MEDLEKKKKYNRKYYLKNREKILMKPRKPLTEEQKKRIKEYKKDYNLNYRAKNKDYFKEKNKEWIKENKEKRTEYLRKNKEHYKELRRVWRAKNRTKQREYFKKKRNEDKQYHLKCLLRTRFSNFLKYKNIKNTRDKHIIDYKAIISHLESEKPENVELYSIDHIIPLNAFNLEITSEIKIAFHPLNHQWLLKEENSSKSDKIDFNLYPKQKETAIKLNILSKDIEEY